MAVVAGVSDDLFGIDVASGELMWNKHFDSALRRSGGRGGDTLCPGGQTAVPVDRPGPRRRASTRSTPCRGMAGCGRSIWPTARTSRRRRSSCRRNGKPYALNLRQRRHLHRERAGLRRRAECVLLVRSGHAGRPASSCRPAAGCGAGAARRFDRKGVVYHRAPATRSSIRPPRVSATASSA